MSEVRRHTESISDEIAGLQAMKLPAFAKWLREQPPDRAWMNYPATKTCPIACFSGCRSAAWIAGMPEWASRFIERFDIREAPYKQSHALEVLASVERDFMSDEQQDTQP